MNYDRDDLPSRLADEYVLGTMKGQARRRFESLHRQSRAFRLARRDAESRWNVLAEALDPVQPSPEVWRNIEARINPAADKRDVRAAPWLALWRAWAVAATLVIAVLILIPDRQPETMPSYVVVITNDVDATAGWLVSTDKRGVTVAVESLTSHKLPGDRVYQLWVKAADSPRVQSVGLIPSDGKTELQAEPATRDALSKAVLFGVSVEPLGGSPTGQPTTEPLFHGKPRNI